MSRELSDISVEQTREVDPKEIDFIKKIRPEWTYFHEGMTDYSYICFISLYRFAAQYCKNKKVLDAASGIGFGCYFLTRTAKHVIGLDTDRQSVDYAINHYKHENLQFLITDATASCFPDQSFDVIVSIETFEHIHPDNARKFLEECRRMLVPGGQFIISTPNRSVHRQISRNPDHINEMDVDDFFNLISQVFSPCEPFYQRKGVLQKMRGFYRVVRFDRLKIRSIVPRWIRRKISGRVAPQLYEDIPVLLQQLRVHRAENLADLKDAAIQIAVCRNPD